MSYSDDLINFAVIEDHKENIQSLPGGHSARALANLFSPSLSSTTTTAVSPSKNNNDTARKEYEAELENISESDDPLDIYDRYVRWAMETYPSVQATPSSQLLPLIERATKTFISYPQYKNDTRYLKLWIYYIQFFSDSPREVFAYLARHNIGDSLAVYYEEFAAWLESAGRWKQAEEIYKLGISKEARPIARLLRKFDEFQKRFDRVPEHSDQPLSPAIPKIRPALSTKLDPFSTTVAVDPQIPTPNPVTGVKPKVVRHKLQIFSDEDGKAPVLASDVDTKGWQSIGSLSERKKENITQAKPWVGETLKAGGKKINEKIPVFKDEVTKNQKGRIERIFVNLEAVYPFPYKFGSELSIEELIAGKRGWLTKIWKPEICKKSSLPVSSISSKCLAEFSDSPNDGQSSSPSENSSRVHEISQLDENRMVKESHRDRPSRKMKFREINETQIIKAKLSPPTGPKISKRKNREQTMTIHTKAATDEIYGLFNQPLELEQADSESSSDGYYTSGGDSTGTGRVLINSEAEDDNETLCGKSVSEWTEFTAQNQIHAEDIECERINSPICLERDCQEYPSDESKHIDPEQKPNTSSYDLSSSFQFEKNFNVPVIPKDVASQNPPFRTYIYGSQNRLPFLTPIAEKTESSLGMRTVNLERKYHSETTPSRIASHKCTSIVESLDNPLSGEFSSELVNKSEQHLFISTSHQRIRKLNRNIDITPQTVLVNDSKCNPTEQILREAILTSLQPPLNDYDGYFDHMNEIGGRSTEIKKFVKAIAKAQRKTSDKTALNYKEAPILRFPGTSSQYIVKRELGAGTFAPVYLIEDVTDEALSSPLIRHTITSDIDAVEKGCLKALKMEYTPSSWEFYMLRQTKHRLRDSRAIDSVIDAYEMHMFKDECYLIEAFHDQGTLLDIINITMADKSGPGVIDEVLVMFFAIELFRTIEELHMHGLLHGDLKVDNCLVRFDRLAESNVWSSKYCRDGSAGWKSKGIKLIDFGRAIDKKVFNPQVQFIADWESCPQDCAEIREMRPWTYQIDYHGLAGILHLMLFGKYIETVADNRGEIGPHAKKTWRLRENLKRYWQVEIWAEVFDILLNATSHIELEDNSQLPITRSMRACRMKMEIWLEANSEKGIGLQAIIRKLETQLSRRK
ncbi:mitotic spindle checkpoint component mad3 [Blumeria hordei DH14]|uniref:Mitotic spindle checkpoint component mad3 n=1 Tax=Blumeria graminis f. sp. hordei (strain DH14) TaxID=546991 RepID=N1JEJ8_BLUG1|nr:mitotic spindle checkpoint component mad3 [Blumeria hordei DH14]